MALEYAPAKIRINAIAPSAIETENVAALIDGPDVEKSLSRFDFHIGNPMVGPGEYFFVQT